MKDKLDRPNASLDTVYEALRAAFPDAAADTQDGLRLSWPDRWVHVRPSGTEPIVRVIAEAPTDAGGARAGAAVARAAGRAERVTLITGRIDTHVRNRRIRRTAKAPTPLLIEGLKRLEYRGYDSAGIAMSNGNGLETRKAKGKISMLEARRERQPDSRHGRHRAHALGDARRSRTSATRTRTSTARARSPSSTTASSRTTARCERCSRCRGTRSSRRPTPKCSRI